MARTSRRNSRRLADHRRSDHAGKALNDVYAHNPFAAQPIPCDAIALFRNSPVQWSEVRPDEATGPSARRSSLVSPGA